jgi:hypothetical protein
MMDERKEEGIEGKEGKIQKNRIGWQIAQDQGSICYRRHYPNA